MTIDEGRRVEIVSLNLFLKRVEFIYSTFDVGRIPIGLAVFQASGGANKYLH
jgi:hypothetical protein